MTNVPSCGRKRGGSVSKRAASDRELAVGVGRESSRSEHDADFADPGLLAGHGYPAFHWLRLMGSQRAPFARGQHRLVPPAAGYDELDRMAVRDWRLASALAHFCAVVLKSILNAQDFLKALAAMWRPVVILAAAGYLLFFNDQGRELGHSLLGQHDLPPIVFLFVALVYWAANTCGTQQGSGSTATSRMASSASLLRIPRNFQRQAQTGMYSEVMSLGSIGRLAFSACAPISLRRSICLSRRGTFPSRLRPFSGSACRNGRLQWLTRNPSFAIALSAPLAIVLATAFVWAEDVTCSRRGKGFASAKKVAIARRVSRAAIVGLLAVLAGLAYVARDTDRIPRGFLPGTICIVLSAMVFLGLISWLRNLTPPLGADASAEERAKDDARQHRQIKGFTVGLFALAFLASQPSVWTFPTWFGALGSMVVAYFAFGAILALINAIELTVEFASGLTIAKQWFEEWATTPRALGAGVVAFAIVFGVVNAWLHPFHRVRLCDGGDCVAEFLPNQRPTVADAAQAWHAQAKAAYEGKGPAPMLIVATAGGGIRAAYWTATVLERLEDDFCGAGQRPPLSLRHQRRLWRQCRRRGL